MEPDRHGLLVISEPQPYQPHTCLVPMIVLSEQKQLMENIFNGERMSLGIITDEFFRQITVLGIVIPNPADYPHYLPGLVP